MLRFRIFLVVLLVALVGVLRADSLVPQSAAAPGAVTVRDPVFGLPHIYADTDLELAREAGREVAKDRLGQLVLLSRVGRGTLSQAFGPLEPSTFDDDVAVRKEGYTSSELNDMYAKLPADVQALILEYCRGVNDIIEEVYAGSQPKPAEVFLLGFLGLGADLFGNATNVSDQVDPFYLAPGGADPQRPNAGFQFTPEMVMAIAVLQVRNFGSEGFGEGSRLNELNSLVAKFPTTGGEIWEDLNFLNDPLAPVSVPDASTPGFGGPLARRDASSPGDPVSVAAGFPDYDYASGNEQVSHREEFARSLGAWPAMGSYAWMIDGERSATDNPWVGGFPQTGIQTPSIMHFVELRSAEGTDHRIQARGMAFAGAPAILIGETDNVAWTSTTAQLKTNETYFEKLILENTNALSYNDEGTPTAMNVRTEQIRATDGSSTPITVWRTHERAGNGGSRTIDSFRGDKTGTADSGTATSLTDAGAFSGDYSGGYVAIVYGTGAGQMRPILSSTADTLTLDGANAWTTAPNASSEYVAVKAGNDMIAVALDRAFWLEESTTALGFSLLQRSESVLDVRAASRLIPSTHNLISADNQAFNSIGTNLGPGAGNTGYYSAGFSRVRQGGSPTDTRLPLDGSVANVLVVVSGTVGSAGSNTLTSTGSFMGKNFSPPGYNFRLNNPSQKGSEYIVTITGGNGHRQTRRIASNTADTLTLEEDWGVVPSAGNLFEVYEIVAMPEAINPSAGYSSNWNNKAATADDGDDFGREHRNIFIAERLAADSDWTRDEQRQLNEDLAGLDGKGKFGRYLIPRIRQAVDGVGNGGNPNVDTVLAALETHNGSPFFGRGFLDPVTDTAIAGETLFLESLIDEVWNAIYADEFSSTGIGVGKTTRLNMLQHAIDSAAGGPAGAYAEAYTGDYFNSADWRVVVRDAFSATVTNLGGVPADIDRPDSTYVHPLSAVYPNLVWNPTPIGNRGHYEQIVEVGPTVRGEFIFSLGQSAFIDSDGLPDPNVDTLHDIWRDWRFVPMLHVAEDLASDPDGDIDNDGVLDGFEKWYFGSNSPAPTADADSDGLNLQEEFLNASDPTDSETDGDALDDGADNCPSAYNPGQEDLDGDDIGDDCDRDKDGEGCRDARELINNEMRGGKRSPDNPYDLYDINGDKLVDLFIDIFGVAAAFGEGPGGPNYTAAKDRSPAPMGQDPWDMGPPDNVIDLFVDIFGVANQFGHDCAA